MPDQSLLFPDRLYYAVVYWLFWNKESKLPLWWLLRFHRRPAAYNRYVEKRTRP